MDRYELWPEDDNWQLRIRERIIRVLDGTRPLATVKGLAAAHLAATTGAEVACWRAIRDAAGVVRGYRAELRPPVGANSPASSRSEKILHRAMHAGPTPPPQRDVTSTRNEPKGGDLVRAENTSVAVPAVVSDRGKHYRNVEDFFRDQYRQLVGYLITTGVPFHIAEDAAQEAMVYAAKRWTEIRSNPGSWARTVAFRIARRTMARDTSRLDHEIRSGVPPEYTPDPNNHSGEAQWVLDLLKRLPKTQRTVMLLSALEELTPAEIAERLGKNPATVRSNLRQARNNLARLLDMAPLLTATADQTREE